MGTPFVVHLKNTFQAEMQLMIYCQHWPYSILEKFPGPILPNCPLMGRSQLKFSSIYWKDKPALTLNEEETMKSAVISPEVQTEWITFGTLLANKPGDSIALQLQELVINERLVTVFQTCTR